MAPAHIRQGLSRARPHWPEYKDILAQAQAWAREHSRLNDPAAMAARLPQPKKCRCGAPAAKRLGYVECVPCHLARFSGERISDD